MVPNLSVIYPSAVSPNSFLRREIVSTLDTTSSFISVIVTSLIADLTPSSFSKIILLSDNLSNMSNSSIVSFMTFDKNFLNFSVSPFSWLKFLRNLYSAIASCTPGFRSSLTWKCQGALGFASHSGVFGSWHMSGNLLLAYDRMMRRRYYGLYP